MKLQPSGDRFFLENGYSYSVPKCGWMTAANINYAFNAKEVRLGGSRLVITDDYYQYVGFKL